MGRRRLPRTQRRAVNAIRAAGAWVHHDYRWRVLVRHIETGYYSDPQLPAPQWLMTSLGEDFFADVAMVAFSERPVGKPALDCRLLKGLIHITYLELSETQVSDADLANVAELTNLTTLHLGETQITDHGLVHLQRLANLRELWLDDTQVTHAGLDHLKNLVGLTNLRLSGASITDAGLKHLSGLTGLSIQ
jgi:Leucine-rich repeat (LRR) protein